MSKVALVQLTSGANVVVNLQKLEPYFKAAHEQGVSLVVLPENFALMGFHEGDKHQVAEVYQQGPIQDFVSALAKKYGLWVIAGTIPLKSPHPQKVTASCLVYDNVGALVGRYDKIHLFDVRVSPNEAHEESKTVERGQSIKVVDTPLGKVGLSVCYDLRFPELYYALMQQGAQLFTAPSAFTETTGRMHWEILIKARAIENLCYMLAPNQCGHHENGRYTYGHSMIVGPWGETLAQANKAPALIIGDINLSELEALRKNFPTTMHHVLKG